MASQKNPKYILTPTELAEVVGKTMAGVGKAFKDKQTVSLLGRRVGLPSNVVQDYLKKEGADFSFKVIAHLNLRGGISKTTASISLASRAYQYGHKVAILDLDSQASASLAFNITGENNPVFINIWQQPEKIKKALVDIEDGFSILPSSLNNGLLDSALAKPIDQKNAVSGICKELKNLGYTLVIIDCSPSLGAAVVSTICAADIISIPVGSDVFSIRGLRLTVSEIKSICSAFGLKQPEIKILFSKYDGREKLSLSTLSELAKDEEYSQLLLPCFIRTSSELPKATKNKETVFATLKKSTAREDYDMYTREILGFNNLSKKELGITQ